jgi:uncharacterized protein
MLRVENSSKGSVLVARGRVANTIWTRFVGLMGARRLEAGDGLAIIPCSSVHCFFMKIPIDVVYVNKGDQVVALDPDLKPWRLGSINRGVRYVIELPVGTIEKTETTVGDRLTVTY